MSSLQTYTVNDLLPQLESVSRVDILGRAIHPSCHAMALTLLTAFERLNLPLPLPLTCGNEEEPPGIYLQWQNASLYIYQTYLRYWHARCDMTQIDGTTDQQVERACEEAKRDRVMACVPLGKQWPIMN